MSKRITVYLSWTAVFALMLLIFFFSSQVAEESGEVSEGFIAMLYRLKLRIFGQECTASELRMKIDALETIVRKLAHFTIYAFLGFLFSNAYTQSGIHRLSRLFALSLISSALYAVTDEFHQLFVEGRSGELRDVLIDSSGAALGALIFILIISGRKLWISRKQLTH